MHEFAPEGRTQHRNRQGTETNHGTEIFQDKQRHLKQVLPRELAELNTTGAFGALIPPLKRAIKSAGYHTPTPIQEKAIPHLLEGRDMLGCAQTGTGKTAAFMLPILQHLMQHPKRPLPGKPRVLVLTPTRELAAQIGESISIYGRYLRVSHVVIYGGVGQQPQVTRLKRGQDIIVATPGRLLDLMGQRHVTLSEIETFVLDEADRMLDMGFIHDIRRVIDKLPKKRQTLFFSATMPPPVVALAQTLVHNAVKISINPTQPTVEKIAQKVLFVEKKNKNPLLISLLDDTHLEKVIVFTRMKHMASKVAGKLNKAGISATAIHGDKSQSARTKALAGFKTGKMRVLVATDVAARGIDVDNISHVINYDMPSEPEMYVHRIGRTARAGLEGTAISFCSVEERGQLDAIEALIHGRVAIDCEHRFHSEAARIAISSAKTSSGSRRAWKPRTRSRNRHR
jgi:ATP-dependent RNA helicase RhlE